MITPCRTFVSDAQPYPRRRNDWERLAQFAVDLLASQAEQLPAMVADGRFTAAAAEGRLRRLKAQAELWRRVAATEALPHPSDCAADLGASLDEISAEAVKFAAFAADRATARREPQLIERAEWLEALSWHLRPVADGALPHIFIAAGFERWLIRRVDQEQAA